LRAKSKDKAAEPWGFQALIQLTAFFVIGALLFDATQPQAAASTGSPQDVPWLLRVTTFVQNDLLTRLNKALEPEFAFKDVGLAASGVGGWALVSLLGNFVSALMLIFVATRPWHRERPLVRVTVALLAFSGIILSVLAVPFLFGALTTASGRHLPIDATAVSALIYAVYLVLDWVSYSDATAADERQRHATLIIAVDLPCFVATSIFFFVNLTPALPATFVVGVASGLLLYYSLSFLFLNVAYWIKAHFGGVIMNNDRMQMFVAIGIGAALNGAIGFFVQLVKLPIYLDVVGSIFVALLFGARAGICSAILGSVTVGLLTTPITIAYVGTAVGVTWAASQLKRYGYGKSLLRTSLLGLLVLGPLSTVLSVPITTYLFSGVTFTGSDLITAAFMKTMGTSLLASVAAGAIVFDAIDKAIASVLSFWLYRATPNRIREVANRETSRRTDTQ
jgi:energy-coupling factor transport system substrate-specific component